MVRSACAAPEIFCDWRIDKRITPQNRGARKRLYQLKVSLSLPICTWLLSVKTTYAKLGAKN